MVEKKSLKGPIRLLCRNDHFFAMKVPLFQDQQTKINQKKVTFDIVAHLLLASLPE